MINWNKIENADLMTREQYELLLEQDEGYRRGARIIDVTRENPRGATYRRLEISTASQGLCAALFQPFQPCLQSLVLCF
jgi:hypothetical protein